MQMIQKDKYFLMFIDEQDSQLQRMGVSGKTVSMKIALVNVLTGLIV